MKYLIGQLALLMSEEVTAEPAMAGQAASHRLERNEVVDPTEASLKAHSYAQLDLPLGKVRSEAQWLTGQQIRAAMRIERRSE